MKTLSGNSPTNWMRWAGSQNFGCNVPKNYQPCKGKHVCKVKRFSLNYNNSEFLNLECMRDAMFNRDDPHVGNYTTLRMQVISVEKKFIWSSSVKKNSKNTLLSSPKESFREIFTPYLMGFNNDIENKLKTNVYFTIIHFT